MTVTLSAQFIEQAQAVGIPLTAVSPLSTGITTTMFVVQVGGKKYTMLTRPLDDGAPQFFAGNPFDGVPLTIDQARVIFDLHGKMTSPHDRKRDAANTAIIKNMLDNPEKFPTAWALRPDTRGGHTTRSASTAPLPEPWPYPPIR
jgi:hypothetical protein